MGMGMGRYRCVLLLCDDVDVGVDPVTCRSSPVARVKKQAGV